MNHLLRTINELAAAWEPAIWRAAWQGGLALLLAWTLCRLLRRAPAAVHCWIWRLAYLKLLVALLWARPVALPVLTPVHEAAVNQMSTAVTVSPVADERETVPTSPAVPQSSLPPAQVSLRGWLLTLWSLGLIAAAGRLAIAWRQTRRWRRSGRPCDEARVLSLRDDLASALKLRQPPELLLCADVATPLLLGLCRPAVLLPNAVMEAEPADGLRVILAHELAHVKRLDLAWDWLPAVAGALFFFHPFVWLANREWHAVREIACDELARRAAGASPPEYGRVLLRLIDGQRSRSPAALAVGIGERAGHFKRRIRAMTQSHFWSKRRLAMVGCALAAVTVVGAVPWRLVAQETAPPSTPPSKSTSPTTTPARDGAATALERLRARRDTERNGSTSGQLGFPARVTSATVELRAPVDGTLKEVKLTEGQAVKRGDTLFQFDDDHEQAAVQIAKAHLDSAAVRLRRLQTMKDANQVSAQELDDTQAAREVAAAELVSAERDLANRTIHAPIAGTTAECGVVTGQYVGKGSLLTTIVGTDELKVEFQVPQSLAGDPSLKQVCHVVFRSQAHELMRVPAKVVYVAPRVDPKTGTMTVKALLDAHGTDGLRAGMYVNVELAGDDK